MSYGLDDDRFANLIDRGILPESLRGFRQTYQAVYDIETLEHEPEEVDPTCPDAVLRPVSIGCSVNIPDIEDKWFCVESSEPGKVQKMVNEFMDHLAYLAEEYQKMIPQPIKDVIKDLRIKLKDKKLKFNELRRRYQQDLDCLKKYEMLPVYAFNGARFDLVVLMPYIAAWCGKLKTNLIKRGAQYMMYTVGDIQFRDILDFTAPTNLDKYLKTWGASEVKSVFPYSHFKSIEELEATVEFPPKSAFFNELKQV